MVSVVDFGTVGYNETETDNTTAFSHSAASQPLPCAGGPPRAPRPRDRARRRGPAPVLFLSKPVLEASLPR